MGTTRRAVLTGLLAGLPMASAWPALASAPKTSLRPVPRPARGAAAVKAAHQLPGVEQLVRQANLSGDKTIVVSDATTGEVLESYKADTALPPASVTKAITALYALQHLGSEFRFTTQVIGTGRIKNGVLKGDLILVGGGDPHMDSDGLANMAAQLKGKGIKRISGKFRVYSRALPYQKSIDPGQPDHVGYNPSVSGINLNFNRVYFDWKRTANGYAVGMDARTDKFRPVVKSVQMRVVNRKAPLFTYKDGGTTENWTVARTALGKAGARWLPVRDTERYAGEVFRNLAAHYGVTLPRAVGQLKRPKGTVLAQQRSGSLKAVVKSMLKYSTNLTAEASGLYTSVHRGSKAGTLAGSAREMGRWLETAYGVKGTKFVDHSGLGDGTRMSSRQMVDVLQKSGWNGQLRPILKDIPLVNSNGKKAPITGVSVSAKTGTLNFASALSGYIDCPNGRKLAFSIFTADMGKRAKISKANRERPQGTRSWRKTSKGLQQKLLRRWALEYGVS